MDTSSSLGINTTDENQPPLPLKRAWIVGSNMVTVIDKSIVESLGINEDNTVFQEEVVEGGILLRIVRH